MPLPLIALGASLAASAINAGLSAKANRDREVAMNKEYARQQAAYDKQLYSDPLEEFHNKAIIGRLQGMMRDRISAAKSRQKITGELDTTNMAKDQNAEALQNVYNNILSNASLRKDSLLRAKDAAYHNAYRERADLNAAKQQNYANLASNAVNLGAAAIGGMNANVKPLKGWAEREQHITDEFGGWQGYYDHLKGGGSKVSNNPNDWR